MLIMGKLHPNISFKMIGIIFFFLFFLTRKMRKERRGKKNPYLPLNHPGSGQNSPFLSFLSSCLIYVRQDPKLE